MIDPNDTSVTLARVAHSDYIWSGVRMVAPSESDKVAAMIARDMVTGNIKHAAQRQQMMSDIIFAAAPYGIGREPGVAK